MKGRKRQIVGIAGLILSCCITACPLGARSEDAPAGTAAPVINPLLPGPSPLNPASGTDTAATPVVRIRSLGSGWTFDQMSVVSDQPLPLTNPGGCLHPDAYVTNPADSGHSLFHSILLSAFLNGRQVQMVVSGCWVDRPRIIAVAIY